METIILPSVLVPIIGIVVPLVGMAVLFIFIEQEDLS